MDPHSLLARWVTIAFAAVAATSVGVAAVGVAPYFFSQTASQQKAAELDSSRHWGPGVRNPIVVGTVIDGDRIAAPAMDQVESQTASQFARYDDIVVEVKPDGSLRVLGEKMEMSKFRTILDDQLRDQWRTRVTIRPDDDCVFRHVRPVISLCEEVGVAHHTQPRSASKLPRLKGPV